MENSGMSRARSTRREIKNCDQEIRNYEKPNSVAWRIILKMNIRKSRVE
jgi:hypothetical protein